MEIIFHKCEFVGEMMPLLDSRKVLYLAGYERIEAVLYNCIHHGQLPADFIPSRGDHPAGLYYRPDGKLAVYAGKFRSAGRSRSAGGRVLEMLQFCPTLRLKPDAATPDADRLPL